MLSVLFATRNRGRILRDVLASYCALESPRSGWQLVVVDNGSTDETPEVIASFERDLPICRVVEPRPGKNIALNAALAFIEGDLTVLTDDDAFPDREWLSKLREAADSHPDYTMFAGAVLPRWEEPPPNWVQWIEQGPVYTLTNPSLREGPIPSFLVFGPNMAVRSSIFEAGVRFDPAIGPRGRDYPMGSETKFTQFLEQQGHRAWYVPAAKVEHLVQKSQLTIPWVMQRAVRYGRGHYRLYYASEIGSRKLLMNAPRYIFREIYEETLLLIKALVFFRHEDVFRSRWRLNFLYGKMREARLLVRDSAKRAQAVPQKIERNLSI